MVQFIVSFVRKDINQDEEYMYNNYEDAKKHFELFRNDDSGLYSKIKLMIWNKDSSTSVLDTINFGNPKKKRDKIQGFQK